MQFFWAIGAVFLAVLAWAVMPTLGKVIHPKFYINTEKKLLRTNILADEKWTDFLQTCLYSIKSTVLMPFWQN
jgi:ABC-type Fe3+ transport system permease subunit